jgi:hypothetical protein
MKENIYQKQSKTIQTPVNNKSDSNLKFKILFLFGSFLMLVIIGFGGFLISRYLFQPKTSSPLIFKTIPTLTLIVSPTLTPKPEVTLTSKPPVKSISIPKDWKEYTAEDSSFGIRTTLSLPPGFSFSFSGSEFSIQDVKNEEIWDYSTSVFVGCSPECNEENNKPEDISDSCFNKPRNYYSGESRRLWYKKFLNGDFFCNDSFFGNKTGEIISVDEEFITDNVSYLKVIVESKLSGKEETHYLYVQNNILHIIKPSSFKANSPDALLPKYINIILYSLKSKMLI